MHTVKRLISTTTLAIVSLSGLMTLGFTSVAHAVGSQPVHPPAVQATPQH